MTNFEIFTWQRFEPYDRIGAVPEKGIKLPFYMGSMEKIKYDQPHELQKWIQKYPGPYSIEEKLDGAAGLLIYDKKGKKSLFSRGEGDTGTNINHLLPYIKLPDLKNMAIRVELIMKSTYFDRYFADKNSNARNTVVGVINSKTISKRADKARKIDPVAFEIIEPAGMKSGDQLHELKKLGFITPINTRLNDLTVTGLNDILEDYRKKSDYTIDGIIVTDDSRVHDRVAELNTRGNPRYAIAFKNQTETAQATVQEVIWKGSRHSKIKPRVRINPTALQGTIITYVTGDNAKYIVDHDIGPDTIVEITRAGEVIPKIIKVIKSTQAQMPNVAYHWNKTGVDIILDDDNNDEVIESIILHFFSKMKAKGISKATIKKLVNNDINSVSQILHLQVTDYKQFFGPRQSQIFYDAVKGSVKNIDMAELIGATTFFGDGIGSKKVKLIIDEYPDFLNMRNNDLKKKISAISGWSEDSAVQFVDGLDDFRQFLKENRDVISFQNINKAGDKFAGQKVVFTGFRDADMEKLVVQQGGTVTGAVSKNTTLVVASDVKSGSSKVIKAKELGIKLISREDFKNLYMN